MRMDWLPHKTKKETKRTYWEFSTRKQLHWRFNLMTVEWIFWNRSVSNGRIKFYWIFTVSVVMVFKVLYRFVSQRIFSNRLPLPNIIPKSANIFVWFCSDNSIVKFTIHGLFSLEDNIKYIATVAMTIFHLNCWCIVRIRLIAIMLLTVTVKSKVKYRIKLSGYYKKSYTHGALQ